MSGAKAEEQAEPAEETLSAATVAAVPRPAEPPSDAAGARTLHETTRLVLHTEEAARANAFGRVITLICAVVLVWLFFLDGPRWLLVTMAATLVVLASVATWVSYRAGRRERYDRSVYRTFLVVSVFASVVVEYFVGVFSVVPLVVTLGISFFGQTGDRRFVMGAGFMVMLGYIVLGTLILTGAIPDLGQIQADDEPPVVRVFIIAIVPFIYGLSLWLAMSSRTAVQNAVERANRALRLAQKREAQLDEAQQNLEELLRAGAGEGGRFTGVVAGGYELGAMIGRGAMGDVYAAVGIASGAPAAVKVLRVDPENKDLQERFRRECLIAAKLQVPSVVRVYHAGELPGGVPYLAMELLAGNDLGWHLRQRQSLPLAEVVELVVEVAAALDAAHEAGIVHRDIKPQNLFLSRSADGPPQWKVLDFGVSKLRDADVTLTRNQILGSPAYMSPEQAQGQETDARSDVFSLGAVAYRALTGRPAFAGPDVPSVLFAVTYGSVVRPGDLVIDLPADVDRVLAVALAKRKGARFASAGAMAAALRAASTGSLDAGLRQKADAAIADARWSEPLARSG